MSAVTIDDRPTTVRRLQIRPAGDCEPRPLTTEEVHLRYAQAARSGLRLGAEPRYVQGSLAVSFEEDEQPDPDFGPQRTTRDQLPDPGWFAQQLIARMLECVSGARPPRQLQRHLAPDPLRLLTERHVVALRRGGARLAPPRIRRVHVCEPGDGVAEISAVVLLEGRVRALALRLEGTDGRWLVSDVLFG